MLTELCGELKNWFIRCDWDKHFEKFTISGGVLTPSDFLVTNQYYRIIGSLFNDGVHKFGDADDVLTDETFKGSVWAMYVPSEVITLSSEIDTWKTKYADTMNSPYQSESFGGYSYSLGRAGWQGVFADRLKKWRKLNAY